MSLLTPEISQALVAAFGNQAVDKLAAMAGGRSGALLLSLSVAGSDYVLRKVDPARPQHQVRLEREFACMAIAAERELAPRLLYSDVANGIAIMAHIHGGALGRTPQHIERAARTLRHLHDGPAFPAGARLADIVAYFDGRLREKNGVGLPGRLTDIMAEIEFATARFACSAPCHNDLNPTNILETADSIFLIDWETACMGDPFLDLAQLGVFNFPGREQREALLASYLARAPIELECARMVLARVQALGFYAAGFALFAALSGAANEVEVVPLVMSDLLALLGAQQGRVAPALVAASLAAEMEREWASNECSVARQLMLS
ncbi:phosphotransferase [Chitinimonas arctica]|uniref:phosphotransferase n=1 Tax=Chitinimonas arctica TaxID=2594795 RepID=UPI0015D33CC6|nr:phosphotransferase [Chitinimonas arctica]